MQKGQETGLGLRYGFHRTDPCVALRLVSQAHAPLPVPLRIEALGAFWTFIWFLSRAE